MALLLLGRFELVERLAPEEAFYRGAEVWAVRDRQADAEQLRSDARAVVYPAESDKRTSTARALWSAELRKLFRLSCQPFDPAIVGFIDGGFDAASHRFVLVMAGSALPGVADWARDNEAGRSCFRQWRGSDALQRAQAWEHVASLFRAVGAIHESRIVHRRIMPENILVDENVPRDESGFLKLGRFEASAFVSAFANTVSITAVPRVHPWYLVEPIADGNSESTGLNSTFSGDVFGMLGTALWLLTGRPTEDDLHCFIDAIRRLSPSEARMVRRRVFVETIRELPTLTERTFFKTLTPTTFSPTLTSTAFHRLASQTARELRQNVQHVAGPLCLALSDNTDRTLLQRWPDKFHGKSAPDLIAQLCADALLWPAKDERTGERTSSEILLPNGLLLKCSVWTHPDGTRDWTRNFVRGVADFGGARKAEPISLRGAEMRVLYGRERAPRNATSWEAILCSPNVLGGEEVDPSAEALEYVNRAELFFWEAQVLPVKVHRAQVTTTREGTRQERVEVVPLRDDSEYPPNPNVRGRPTPKFMDVLQDKVPPIRVQLASQSKLWDEATDRITYVEPTHVVVEIDAEKERLVLRRDLRASDFPTSEGHRAYMVTADQGWQMGLFRRRQAAIRSLSRHATLSAVLGNPRARSVSVVPPNIDLPFQRWNSEKSTLVSKALSVAPLLLVEGPPGTGKSTFVSGLMRHILSMEEDPSARILVVAQQHTAIDELHARVRQMFAGTNEEEATWGPAIMLRLSSREQVSRREDSEDNCESTAVLRPEAVAKTLFEPCLKSLGARVEQEFLLLRNWLQTELASDRLSPAMEQRVIDASSMIFTTCTDRYLDDISSTEFDWVIIEEGGRVIGCDLVIPLRLGHRWVLIGDPKQLGPYRLSDFDDAITRTLQRAEQAGVLIAIDRRRLESDCRRLLGPFGLFFSELEGTNQRYSLTVQHRMHPDIRRIVSTVFYEGLLSDDPTTSGIMPYLFSGSKGFLADRAVAWIDVPHLQWPDSREATQDQRDKRGYSYRNPTELEIIRQLISHIAVYETDRREASRIRVAIITPYKLQMRELDRVLDECADSTPEWLELEGAFTADAYQGREADIVILSMVRNNVGYETGFLDQFRMNVSLSRAHRLLVVVGCFKMFEQSAEHPHAGEDFVRPLVEELRPHVVPAREFIRAGTA